MIERVLLFHDDGTVEEYRMRMDAPPPLAPLAPPKRSKKRAAPRKRCPICDTLHPGDKFADHVKTHDLAEQILDAVESGGTVRSWEEIEQEAERIAFEETRALEEPGLEEVM